MALCEGGGESPDRCGPGARLIGLTRGSESLWFAKNNTALTDADIARVGTKVAEGNYRGSGFRGASRDPFGRTLFVNMQVPGITLAITTPWLHGPP